MRQKDRTRRRKNCQQRVQPGQVRSLAESLMVGVLKREAHGDQCTTPVLLQVLYWAAPARCASITAACVILAEVPAEAGRPQRDRREILDGIFWVLRTGSPWRDWPEEFGPWKTVYNLFNPWNSDGTFDEIPYRLQAACIEAGEIDSELWCLDGTNVRAARCAAGGGKKGTPRNPLTTLEAARAGAFRRKSLCCATARALLCTSNSRQGKHTKPRP